MASKEILIEIDMLQGNINRMCVTNKMSELDYMHLVAVERLNKIYTDNMHRLSISIGIELLKDKSDEKRKQIDEREKSFFIESDGE